MQKVITTRVGSLFVDVTHFSCFQGNRSALESPLHPQKVLWGSVFIGLAVGHSRTQGASFLQILNIFLMNLRKNTEAETAEMTNRCMRSSSSANLRKMPGFQYMFVEHGKQQARGKKHPHCYSLSCKDSLLKTNMQMCIFLQITCVRDTLIFPSVFH